MALVVDVLLCFAQHQLQVFNEAIESAVRYKEHSDDFVDQVMQLLHEVSPDFLSPQSAFACFVCV